MCSYSKLGLASVGGKECISTWRAERKSIHGNPTKFQQFGGARESLQVTEGPIWS